MTNGLQVTWLSKSLLNRMDLADPEEGNPVGDGGDI